MRKKFFLLLSLGLFILFLTSNLYAKAENFLVGDKVKTKWLGKWHVCTVIEIGPDQYKLHFEDDDRIFDRWFASSQVYNYAYRIGDTVLVRKGGIYVSAKILLASSTKYKIHYEGTNSSEDEWVGPDRIVVLEFRVGEKVLVFYKNGWYPANIMSYQNGKYYIHYVGLSSDQDRWVTADKIRKYPD